MCRPWSFPPFRENWLSLEFSTLLIPAGVEPRYPSIFLVTGYDSRRNYITARIISLLALYPFFSVHLFRRRPHTGQGSDAFLCPPPRKAPTRQNRASHPCAISICSLPTSRRFKTKLLKVAFFSTYDVQMSAYNSPFFFSELYT